MSGYHLRHFIILSVQAAVIDRNDADLLRIPARETSRVGRAAAGRVASSWMKETCVFVQAAVLRLTFHQPARPSSKHRSWTPVKQAPSQRKPTSGSRFMKVRRRTSGFPLMLSESRKANEPCSQAPQMLEATSGSKKTPFKRASTPLEAQLNVRSLSSWWGCSITGKLAVVRCAWLA